MDTKDNEFQSMMASFLQNAKKMQKSLQHVYQDMAENNSDQLVQGKAGGDLVIAHVNLKLQVMKLDLKPELLTEQSDVIAELIVSAVNQGLEQARLAVKDHMLSMVDKIGLPKEFPMPFGTEKG